jgi:hypothetical protein
MGKGEPRQIAVMRKNNSTVVISGQRGSTPGIADVLPNKDPDPASIGAFGGSMPCLQTMDDKSVRESADAAIECGDPTENPPADASTVARSILCGFLDGVDFWRLRGEPERRRRYSSQSGDQRKQPFRRGRILYKGKQHERVFYKRNVLVS